jgi:hypothetical protein
MTAKEFLQKTLDSFDNGNKWQKFWFKRDNRYCVVGAFTEQKKHTGIFFDSRLAICALQAVLPAPFICLTKFNDAPETTFEDVKRLFENAMERCPE